MSGGNPVDFTLQGVTVETDHDTYEDVIAVRTHGDTLWIVTDPEAVSERTRGGPVQNVRRLWQAEADTAVPWRRVVEVDRGPVGDAGGGREAGGAAGDRGGPGSPGPGPGDRRGPGASGDTEGPGSDGGADGPAGDGGTGGSAEDGGTGGPAGGGDAGDPDDGNGPERGTVDEDEDGGEPDDGDDEPDNVFDDL